MTSPTISTSRPLRRVIYALLLTASLCGCNSRAAVGNDSPNPICVTTLKVQACADNQLLTLAGQTEPFRRTTPASRLMARVDKLAFKEGDRVAAGTVLIRLDTRDLSARQQQANAAINTASTAYATSQRNLTRMRALMESGTISKTQYENMQVAHAQALASLSTAQAARRELNVNLADATVVAPFDGVIVRKMVELGDTVSPGQPMFVIEDDSRLRLVAAVASDLTGSLRPRQTLAVRMGEQQLKGVIEAVVSSGVAGAAGQRLQVIIDNPAQEFKSGSLATLSLPGGTSATSGDLLIPASALVAHGQLRGAFVVGPDRKLRLHWLVTDAPQGQLIKVLAGLSASDRVVLDPQGLTDGQLVQEIRQ